MLKKLITCTLLSSIALTGVNMLEYSPKIDQNHIAQAAEIDKYPRPIKNNSQTIIRKIIVRGTYIIKEIKQKDIFHLVLQMQKLA
ncbi:hypothetical protein AAHH64_11920 [Staphylococcus epidermidis]